MRNGLVERPLHLARLPTGNSHPRIKGSKDIAYKNQLDWVTSHSNISESERIWPLKAVMNPVWQKLHLGMVSESMCSEILTLCEEERDAWVVHCQETGMLENSG